MFKRSSGTNTVIYECPTKIGGFGVMLSDSAIKALFFPETYENYSVIENKRLPLIEKLSHDLNAFFNKNNVDWSSYEFDLLCGTDYQRTIWNTLRSIPYGTCWSYSQVAEIAGLKGARAIGNACNKNPIPIIIPCHRVIHKNRHLGGFGSGIKWKKFLLECEGLRYEKDKLLS